MKKVLHVSDALLGGGRERRMLQLIKGLSQEKDIAQHLAIPSQKMDYNDLQQINIEINCFGDHGRFDSAKKLFKIIKEFKPDVVHVWSPVINTLFWCSFYKLFFRYKYISGFVADGNKVSRFSLKYIVEHFSFIMANVVVSNSKAGLLAKKAPLRKSKVIYNGFDYNRFNSKLSKEEIRKKLGITTKYVAGMFARFSAEKDYQTFMSVAKMAKEASLDITFLAVGKGPLFNQFNDFVLREGLDNVLMLGFRNDAEELLMICDISMLYTNNEVHSEGVSNSIMEAMAAGKPVIATDGGGTPEIITNEKNGYIINPKDSTAAFALIEELLKNESLRNKIGNAASNTIKERFLLSQMTADYKNLYMKL